MENVFYYLFGCATTLIIVGSASIFYSLRNNRKKINILEKDIYNLIESHRHLSNVLVMERKEISDIIHRESQNLNQEIWDNKAVLDNTIDNVHKSIDKLFELVNTKQSV